MQALFKPAKALIFFVAVSANLYGCSKGGPVGWWRDLNKKAEHLAKVEVEYEVLKNEYDALQKNYFKLEAEYFTLRSELETKQMAIKNLEQAGTKSGRHLANINYQIPNGLKPEAIRALAFEHFKERRFEESVVCFEHFLSLPEGAATEESNLFYTLGVAWYEVKNFYKSRENFEMAVRMAKGDEREKVTKKVELWMRVVDASLAKEKRPALEALHEDKEIHGHRNRPSREAKSGAKH